MSVDAISLAVFKSLFASVAEVMGVTLQQTSLSPNIKERRDFSCAVFDATGRMIAQAAHIPIHLGSMPASVAAALAAFESLSEGDVIILNSPYDGGTHLPDITLLSPYFSDGRLAFFLASRAHHADVGGMSPGSLPLSTELYQEGIIIPPIKLIDGGQRMEGILKLITTNSRTSDERLGDLDAQLAAHHVGAKRLHEMIQKYGIAHVEAHAEALINYARDMMQAVIREIPDGVYRFEDALEGDGQAEFRISIHAEITVEGDQMRVDYSKSADQVRGNLNAVPALVRSVTWYCIRLLASDDVPMNHGCFEPIEVITRQGSLLNPHFPAGVAVGNTETAQRIADVVLGALAQALPDRIPSASCGTMNNVTCGGIYDGQPFVYYETIGGGHGASSDGDGISGRHTHMTNTHNTPVEALERVLPMRVLAYGLRENSGGTGLYRGGEGIRRVYEFTAPTQLTFNTERRNTAPYGLNGGEDGQSGQNFVIQNGELKRVPAKYTVLLEAGDQAIIETPGGGGWGKSDRSYHGK